MTGSHEDRSLDELDLLAYADGLLDTDPARREEVECRLRASPELAARVEAYRSQAAALRRVYGARAQEPVPERLLEALARPERRIAHRAAGIAAVLALTVCAGAGGWLLGRVDIPVNTAKREFVARSYQDYVTQGKGADIRPSGQTTPLNWLSRKVSLTLRAPNLTAEGYSLVNSQTVKNGARMGMVRLTYSSKAGESFSLFLYPRWRAESRDRVQMTRKGDVSLAYWLDGPLASVIASRLPPEETRAISDAVRSELNDPDAARPELSPVQEPSKHPAGNMADNAVLPDKDAVAPPTGEPAKPGFGARKPGVIAN